jgi:cyclopropane-fatty-acyl-phospholipid synthase
MQRERALALLRTLFGEAYARDFAIELWDGTRVEAARKQRYVFRVGDPAGLRAAIGRPIDLCAGRAFVAGMIGIDGDLEAAIDDINRATTVISPLRMLALARSARHLPNPRLPGFREARLRGRPHSIKRDRRAVAFHYDLPLEFYETFLDPLLVYSCAYFDDGIDDLNKAQEAKLDYILTKLRLQPGERFLDIGCGWGSLVLRAAQKFGARALGITLSRRQYDEARRRIAEADAGERAQIELLDYRELRGRTFDKIASVGMFEHVGRSRLPAYFEAAFRALRPGGLFLNHGIANQEEGAGSGRATGFIERFIFPDGELVGISDALTVAEEAGFEIRDVENLREHYAKTLRAWVARLERNRERAIELAGPQSYRAWRLYMSGSAQGFRVGRMGLFQSLLARKNEDGVAEVPATRRDLYQRPAV